jgi:hypothetical protein
VSRATSTYGASYALRQRCESLDRQIGREDRTLYAARPRGMAGPIKLGRTKHLSRRIEQIASEIGRSVELLAAVPEWWCREGEALRRFAAHRVWSEWFSPHPELLSFVEAMAKAAARCGRVEQALQRINESRRQRPLALVAAVEREMARRRRWTVATGVEL